MGCLSSDAVKLPLFIHPLPCAPDEPDHEFPRVSSKRRVRARAVPVTLSFVDVTEADLPTIGPHGEAEFLLACKLCDDSHFLLMRSCGSNPWLRAPFPVPSDLCRPSSRGAGLSTHTGMEVNHSPLSTLFWRPRNSSKAPNSTSSIAVVLQEQRNTCTT